MSQPEVRTQWLVVALVATLSLAACEGLPFGEPDTLVGIEFQNGVECLGEEAQPVGGDDVYVSPAGDDTNAGTSVAAPFATLGYALCNLQPGQTLHVLPGIYKESVILGVFGTADAPIAIVGEPEGDRLPVLDGEGQRSYGIALVESVNVSVENLEFRNFNDAGLYVLTGADITIRNNRFMDNGRASIEPDSEGEGFGVNVDGTARVVIEGNEAAGNGPNEERVARYILGTGINTFELRDAVIRGNYSHDNIGGGILVEDSETVLVEDNRVADNELDANGDYWDGGIWVDGGRDVVLRANTIMGNHGPGIEISDEDVQYPAASVGYVLAANQVTDNLYGVYVWNFGQCPLPPEDALRLEGNTIEGNTDQDWLCDEWGCGEGQACD